MSFIAPMLCVRLEDPAALADPRYIAEPKLDGQRAQVHIGGRRTTHCYSRTGRDFLGHPGMTWLRELVWPVAAAVLDGEVVAGDGHEGIQSVLLERNRVEGNLAFLAFDVLAFGRQSVMREPWSARRKRLEDLCDGARLDRVAPIPVTDDASTLWDIWIGQGGEGIVLKDRSSVYRPGERSATWLKLKPQLTLDATITGGSAVPIPWGDRGLAVTLELRYRHPRSGDARDIRQAVRISRDQRFELTIGATAELVCWGVMPSGLLRHPVFVRWRS